MPHRSQIPPRAVELEDEFKPRFGERREDHDKLARMNAKIARYRYIIGFIIMLLTWLGLRAGVQTVWPEQRFRDLESGQEQIRKEAKARADTVNTALSRVDSVNIANAVVNLGMAKFACLKSTPEQAQLLPWSCKRLFDTGELVVRGNR
jgi:hypothetical protein